MDGGWHINLEKLSAHTPADAPNKNPHGIRYYATNASHAMLLFVGKRNFIYISFVLNEIYYQKYSIVYKHLSNKHNKIIKSSCIKYYLSVD